MGQRFLWGGLAAALAVAMALAAPAEAQQLVFDVSITSVTNSDFINGTSTTTPFNLQYVEILQLGGLPPPGSSVYHTYNFGSISFPPLNLVQTGDVVTQTPLDATQVGLATAVPAPLVVTQVEFDGQEGQGSLDAAIQMTDEYSGGDGLSQAYGGDLNLTLSSPVQALSGDPPPRTINQMLGLFGGVWAYSYEADSYNEMLDGEGDYVSGFGVSQEYDGTATLDLSRSSLTPEPQTWALMILGFGCLGGLIRAQRRHTRLPAVS